MALSDFWKNIFNADLDALTLDDFINGEPNKKVKSRLGREYFTLATIDKKLKELSTAIQTALSAGAGQAGWTDSLIVTESGRTQAEKNSDIMTIKDFGGVGDGVTDDTQSVKKFIDYMLRTGKSTCYQSGTYLVTEQILIDMGLYSISRYQGFRMYGEGLRRSIIKSTYKNGSAFIIKSTASGQGGNCFYPEILGMGFESNAPYPCVQIGQQDFSDEINAVNFHFSANNADTTANSCGVEINGMYQGVANITANSGGTSTLGDAVRIRQMQFVQLTGSGGNAANSIHFTGGTSYSNVITNWDAEEVKTCVKIDVASAASNTFVGGQFSWSVCAIDATAGSNNYFLNPNFGLASNRIAGNIGITVVGQGKSYGMAYQPMTVFANPLATDNFNRYEINQGYSSGQVWQLNNQDKFRVDSDGNILVTRAYNTDLNQWLDASYVDTAGVLNINQAKVNYFGLQKTPISRQTVTGSKNGIPALASLITALNNFGIVEDRTT